MYSVSQEDPAPLTPTLGPPPQTYFPAPLTPPQHTHYSVHPLSPTSPAGCYISSSWSANHVPIQADVQHIRRLQNPNCHPNCKCQNLPPPPSIHHQWTSSTVLINDGMYDRGRRPEQDGNSEWTISHIPGPPGKPNNEYSFQGLPVDSQNGLPVADARIYEIPSNTRIVSLADTTTNNNMVYSTEVSEHLDAVKKQRRFDDRRLSCNQPEDLSTTVPGKMKVTFTCPSCKRSYDWKYNLNRHIEEIKVVKKKLFSVKHLIINTAPW